MDNIYVVDEITGRMYLSKREHLMRIAETVSHRPFQDHELSISRHVPEREYAELIDRLAEEKVEMDQRRGNLDPITPIVGATGGTGRTPIPVAESTHQPEKEMPTSGNVSRGEGLGYKGVSTDSRQSREGLAERDSGFRGRGELEWALPKPTEPHRPPGEGAAVGRYHPIQLINWRGSFLARSTLSQSNGWWKPIKDVGENWLPWQEITL